MLELLEHYVDSLRSHADALESAYRQNDFQTLTALAHQLKGTGGGYGFDAITDAARQLEVSAREGEQLDRVDAWLKTLVSLCRRATAARE